MLENWQLGREVKVITKEEEDVLESKEDKAFTVLKKRKVSYFESDSVHEEKKSTKDESSEKPAVDVTSTIIMPTFQEKNKVWKQNSKSCFFVFKIKTKRKG